MPPFPPLPPMTLPLLTHTYLKYNVQYATCTSDLIRRHMPSFSNWKVATTKFDHSQAQTLIRLFWQISFQHWYLTSVTSQSFYRCKLTMATNRKFTGIEHFACMIFDDICVLPEPLQSAIENEIENIPNTSHCLG